MTRTGEPAAAAASDPELVELGALYARHSPDLERITGDHMPLLLAAARSHRRLAARQTPGETLIRVRDGDPGAGDPEAGGRAGGRRSSPTTCRSSSSPCWPGWPGPAATCSG